MSTETERWHLAARAEDRLSGAVASLLRRRGWRPRVLGYTGYGAEGWVRIFGRVLLSPPRRGEETDADRRDPQRGWRAFVTLPVGGHPVTVDLDADLPADVSADGAPDDAAPGGAPQITRQGARHEVLTDRSGYIDVRLPAQLAPGWHRVSLSVGSEVTASCDVHVVEPTTRTGVVSDIDDTVMVTLLPRPLIAAWNTFVLREHARRPVAGMAELLQQAEASHPGAITIYLSTGAWNVAPTLTRFLARHDYPPGPMLLTDWGPTRTGWFRSGVAHKRGALRRLVEELPDVRWLLIGDDGQRDPEIYGDFVDERPGSVLAVGIRELSPAEHVLATGTAGGPPDDHSGGGHDRVPWVTAPDGTGLLRQLRQHGVL